MLQLFRDTHIKFMKAKYLAFLASAVIIVASLVNILVHKGLNYGVDFAGGTLLRIMFKDPISVSEIRRSLSAVGLGNSRIQEVGEESREFLIRTLQPAETEERSLEAHEILANRVLETLRAAEGKDAVERDLQDLNSLNLKSLVFLLESAFPEKAEDLARKIIDYRIEKGILGDFSELASLGLEEEVLSLLREKTFLGPLAVLSRETVGPQVGQDLRNKATQATVWALLGMLVYIGLRFKLAYGVAAVITLFHDVIITVGIFSMTEREINLPVIAAILTIVGYSLNDTIVIFDRIRDNLKLMRKTPLEDVLNVSINQTLSRTVITSGTTLLTVVALFLFGGEVINDFAFTLIIGILIGTYSSIYQSCALVYLWHKIFKTKKGLK